MTDALPLSLDEATRISEMAFLPLRAITQRDLDDASYSLRVENASDEVVLSIAHVARSQYADAAQLAALLDKARLELSKDGHTLAPWSMPYQPGVAGS